MARIPYFRSSVFISCSSKSLAIAEVISEIISENSTSKTGPEIKATTWRRDTRSFELNRSTLDGLFNVCNSHDFAIILLTGDDTIKMENEMEDKKIPRDNVIFEMGLFLGRLNKKRVFVVYEENAKLLSNMHGITTLQFKKPSNMNNKADIKKAVEDNCNIILDKIYMEESGLDFLPSTALALGYCDNFVSQIFDPTAKFADGVSEQDQIMTFVLEINMPKHLIELKNIEYYIKLYKYKKVSIEKEGRRAFQAYYDPENQYSESGQLRILDFPTTLFNSYRIIKQVISHDDFDMSDEAKKLEKEEIKNFRKVIKSSIKDLPYNNRVFFTQIKK